MIIFFLPLLTLLPDRVRDNIEIMKMNLKRLTSVVFRVIYTVPNWKGGKAGWKQTSCQPTRTSNWWKKQFGCPNCHNRNMDELVWLDDETVKCTRCNTEYQP